MLKDTKHELFAQGLASGKNVDEAYIDAGFAPGRGNASRLKQRPEIQARLTELLSAGAARAEVTAQGVVTHLYEIYDKAAAAQQFGPAT
jgi:phage terminase small subunit